MANNKLSYLILSLFLISLFNLPVYSQFEDEIECFSMIAGNNATINNSVLIAHNEDDWGDLLVNWYKVPAQNHKNQEIITLQNGATIPQVPHTYSYLWIEMPGMKFSDSYMNEWGVTIASDQCKSREDKAKIINGGIGYYLRRIMAERAKNAREAIKIAGKLIDSLGYNYSGRTYCIADPNEAWMLAVIKGKHWVAQRIPDNNIAVIPNCYTIDEINMSDTINFLGSRDIVDYAIERGWYKPDSRKKFSFKYAYAAPNTINAIWNKPRFMTAVNMLAEEKIHYGDNFPFSFKPLKKISKNDLMKVLASHLEDTDFESCNTKNPHDNIANRICSPGNQYGFVTELRKNMPKEIAYVMWIAIKRPCTQAFIPWYFGINDIPEDFTYQNWESALTNHFSRTDLKEKTKNKAYWAYKALADYTDKDYFVRTITLIENKKLTENKLFEYQQQFEKEFISLYNKNKNKAIDFLNNYENKIISKNLKGIKQALNLIN